MRVSALIKGSQITLEISKFSIAETFELLKSLNMLDLSAKSSTIWYENYWGGILVIIFGIDSYVDES